MKPFLSGIALLSVALAAFPATAQVAGPWLVAGVISGTPFASDCRFEDRGGGTFGGVCVDSATGNPRGKPGTVHQLTMGQVKDGQVSWTYAASFMLAKFNVDFTGALAGGRMTGTITAFGRKGGFTATRK
jgi:hypothetical protein